MERIEKQLIEIENWRHSRDRFNAPTNGCGTLNWITGMGKTYTSCLIINKIFSKNTNSNVLILVPYTNLMKQWKDEINKNCKQYLNNIKVLTVQYYLLHNLYFQPTLLIIDELDEFYSDERVKIITKDKCNYKFGLGLTATFQEKQKRHKIVEKYLPIVSVINEKLAVDNGWISKSIEYNLGIELDENELSKYLTASSIIAKEMAKFNDFSLALKTLQGDYVTGEEPFKIAVKVATNLGWRNNLNVLNPQEKEIKELYAPNKIIGYAKNLVANVKIRQDILNLCKQKYIVTLDILEKFKGVKTITFSQSTIFANNLHSMINKKFEGTKDIFGNQEYEYATIYHSNIETQTIFDAAKNKTVKMSSTKLKERAIQLIKSGKSRVIVTAKALDKGFDVKDIRLGIITSGSSNYNQHKQRGGRIKRIEDIPTDLPVLIINIYCKATTEEFSLKERQKLNTFRVKWIDNIEDITYTQETQIKML